MAIVQVQFESRYEPPTVIGQWWKHYGMGGGTKLPDPLVEEDASTCGGYADDLWVNLELWGKPGTKQTVARLSAQPNPFGEANVRRMLEGVIDNLQPPVGRGVPATALAADTFTWLGGWDWTTEDSDPGNWGMAKMDEILATVPRGLCASDGSLIGDGSKNCKFGFVDAPRRAVYLGYDYLASRADSPSSLELEIIDGCGSVPIDTIPGIRVLKASTAAYSGAVSSDGRTLAVIEYSNSIEFGRGYISLIDVDTAQERRLTWFTHASGGEQIAFSPDDRWLLVPRSHRDSGALVIDTATGAQRSFDDLDCATCWWVRDGRLGLLCFGHGHYDEADFDPYDVTFFDLTSGQTSPVVRIKPPDFTLEPLYRSSWNAVPFADGRIMLSRNLPPVNERYNVTGSCLAVLDLSTGDLTQAADPFADPDCYVQRKQSGWHWNSPLALNVTAATALLEEGMSQVDMEAWPSFNDEYGAVIRVDFGSPFITGRY